MNSSFHSALAPDIESFIKMKRSPDISTITKNISCTGLIHTGKMKMIPQIPLQWNPYPDG